MCSSPSPQTIYLSQINFSFTKDYCQTIVTSNKCLTSKETITFNRRTMYPRDNKTLAQYGTAHILFFYRARVTVCEILYTFKYQFLPSEDMSSSSNSPSTLSVKRWTCFNTSLIYKLCSYFTPWCIWKQSLSQNYLC